ncbi:MAG: hypothetical protein NTZ13_00305 [Candidatus Parcubacteria bacterium]|nr:hypothetical protein [Candidatus Parcubacteria bacterium]
MMEFAPKMTSPEEEKKQKKISLALELSQNQESFSFPGINTEAYARLKADEEEFPGFATPIDEIIERCKKEGVKVVLGKNPESGNVYILPVQSNDIENDGIFPKHLQMNGVADEKLKELISMG